MKLQINPSFRDLLPPLSAETYAGLEADIVRDGCRDPLKVWGNTLIDGHNRLSICEKHGLDYQTEQITSIETESDAINWIINNQINKRNLTAEERRYLIGIRYRQEKKQEPFKGNQHTDSGAGQNVHNQTTAEKIAAEYKMDEKAVRRAEKFADGVDAIAKVNPALRDEIISGNSKLTVNQVAAFAQPAPPPTKTCLACGQELPVSDFPNGRNVCTKCRSKQVEKNKNYIDPALTLKAPPEQPTKEYQFSDEQYEYLGLVNDFLCDMSRFEGMPRAFANINKQSEIYQSTQKLLKRMTKIMTHMGGNINE